MNMPLVLASIVAVTLLLYHGTGHPSRTIRAALLASSGVALLTALCWALLPNGHAALLVLILLLNAAIGLHLARRQLVRRSRFGLLLAAVVAFAFYGAVFGVFSHGQAAKGGASLAIPISLGFFSLRQIHLVYECYRRGVKTMGWLDWCAYLFFIPTLIAGPLERLGSFQRQLAAGPGRPQFNAAATLLVSGAFKKIVIADFVLAALLPPAATVQAGFEGLAWAVLVFACAMRLLHLYFDFAGYTDMARGVGRLFGFDLTINFDRPLLRPTLAQFWRGWHISLSAFMRDYVYLPLLAQTRKPALAITASMLAIGLWHGVQPGWMLWALHHALGLVVLARLQRGWLAWPAFQRWRASPPWFALSLLTTWLYLAAGSAFIWQPADPALGLAIYARFWTLGAWP